MVDPQKEFQAVEAWLGSNWWPFSVGAASAVAVLWVLHLVHIL